MITIKSLRLAAFCMQHGIPKAIATSNATIDVDCWATSRQLQSDTVFSFLECSIINASLQSVRNYLGY